MIQSQWKPQLTLSVVLDLNDPSDVSQVGLGRLSLYILTWISHWMSAGLERGMASNQAFLLSRDDPHKGCWSSSPARLLAAGRVR